jgi:TonB family protein
MSHRSLTSKSIGALAIIALPMSAVSAADPSSIIEQNYPAESLSKGEQGVVEFAVDLDKDAGIDSCVVTRSSGYPLLDAATCDVIVKHAQFSPAESGGKRVATTRAGRIAWKLPKSHAANARLASAPDFQTSEKLESQRLICQKSSRVGSLVKTVKFCLTQAEWSEGRHLTQQSLNPATGGLHGCHLRAGFGCN